MGEKPISLNESNAWKGYDIDPNDEHFVDIVDTTSLEQADDYSAILVGEPYDGGQVLIRGAATGPTAIREALVETKTRHLTNGAIKSVGDIGDIDIPWGRSVSETHKILKKITKKIYQIDSFPIFLGGGHDLAYPNASPLLEQHESVGIINFDAHADVREVVDEPHNGTPFRRLIDEGLSSYSWVGARHFETSNTYVDYLKDIDGAIISAEDLRRNPRSAAEKAVEQLGDVDAIYVSSDLDVLDMTVAPATVAPTPGGIQTVDWYDSLREVMKEERVIGFELIGCAPALGTDTQRAMGTNLDPTAMAGSRAVAHVLSALGNR